MYEEVGKIVTKFELLECYECAEAVMQWLNDNGIEGKVIRLKTKYRDEDFILSDRLMRQEKEVGMSGGLYEILEKIRVRPGMYIGRASVTVLFDFLVGYKTARRELGIELTNEDADFCEHFHEFVERKHHLRTSNSWAKIIMLYCHHEKDGFDNFYKLLDEFKNRDKSLDTKEKVAPMKIDAPDTVTR
ncbi:hypothetical protein F7734_54810 [Scytonema sp. UIC 10036]|nr:hypothetical protein [Scytonema sp. UIC 10036]